MRWGGGGGGGWWWGGLAKSIFFVNRKRLTFNKISWPFLTYFWLFLANFRLSLVYFGLY